MGGQQGKDDQETKSTPTPAKNSSTNVKKEKIFVNVYEPVNNDQMQVPGFGIYHSGVQVYGAEYTFAGGESGTSTGVYSQAPRFTPTNYPWKFKESIEVGETTLTKNEIKDLITVLKIEFTQNSYHLVNRNCNHFSEALCKSLGVSYPNWINRAAKFGSALGSIVPQSLQQQDKKQEVKPLSPSEEGAGSKVIYVDLLNEIDKKTVACLNESSQYPLIHLLLSDKERSNLGIKKKRLVAAV